MTKISESTSDISLHALSILIPEEILNSFELERVIENEKEILFSLVEKKECIPESLKGLDVVLNGFMNPSTLQSFPLKGKNCYIHLSRRRWKLKGSETPYEKGHNDYEFTATGTLATKEFGAFLKRNSLIPTPSLLAQSL